MADCGHMDFAPDDFLCRRYGLGAAALRYAEMGYPVLPLERGGKRPHRMLGERGGVHLASRAEEDITDWWSLDMAANVGVATGSGLMVIDLDVKRGANGPLEFARFIEPRFRDFPDSPWLRTPSGGRHLWFRAPGGVPERPGILPGVDVKGDGGLVVVPPSVRLVQPLREKGEVPVPYEWASGCPCTVPPVPPWVTEWAASAPAAPRVQVLSTAAQPTASLDGVMPVYLKHGLPAGMRNREMYRIACALYRLHGTDAYWSGHVLAVCREVYLATDKRDFGWNEVLTCLDSARRFVEQQKASEARRDAQFLAWMRNRGI